MTSVMVKPAVSVNCTNADDVNFALMWNGQII